MALISCRDRGGPTLMVVLRYSVELQNPGCMHVIFESVSAVSPYLMENRTTSNLQYRQAGYPGIPYRDLASYSAEGYISQVPTSAATKAVSSSSPVEEVGRIKHSQTCDSLLTLHF